MLHLLETGQYQTFALLLFTIVLALTWHEYGHAITAKHFGDRTAEQQGRLTLNPIAHIDPLGLLMIVMIGFGWARPVPVNQRGLNKRWAMPVIAAAGPLVNLALAVLVLNLYGLALSMDAGFAASSAAREFTRLFVTINVALFLFNLIPIGPLDGHYILPSLLPKPVAILYVELNARYGSYALLGLILLSFAGLNLFAGLWRATGWLSAHLSLF